MYTLEIDMPNLPKGGTLIIDGLGEFKNGESADISDEDAAAYQARNAIVTSAYNDEGKLETTIKPGLSLADVFANHPSIKVTVKAAPFVAPKIAPPLTSNADSTNDSTNS